MPYCPACHSEYREGIAICVHCERELVAELPEPEENRLERLRSAVKTGAAVSLLRANYAEICRMVELLQSHGVDAVVTGEQADCKSGSCAHFLAMLLPEDMDAARRVLQSEQFRLIDSDDECRSANLDAFVDFDVEGQHQCPACQHVFEGVLEECPECGLFLGVG